MKKSAIRKKILSLVLAALVLFSVSLCAFAEYDPFASAQPMPTGTVTIKNGDEKYFKFIAEESGVYVIEIAPTVAGSTILPYVLVANSNRSYIYEYFDGTYDPCFDYSPDVYFRANKGKTYYIKLANCIEVSGEQKPGEFNATVAFLGTPVSGTVKKAPDRTVYYSDYDYYINTDEYNEPISLWRDPTGLVADVTFSDGSTRSIGINAMLSFLCYNDSYTGSVLHYTFVYGDDTNIFTVDIELQENPVESIEVIQLPKKTNFVYGIDGNFEFFFEDATVYFYPGLDYDGLKIQINYTDGTKEVVDMSGLECDYYGNVSTQIKGYDMETYAYNCPVGTNSVSVHYLGRDTTFDINVKKPPLIIKFILNLAAFLIKIKNLFASLPF